MKIGTRPITKNHCVICGQDFSLTKFRVHARQQHYSPKEHQDFKERINLLVEKGDEYVRQHVANNPNSDYFFS